MAGMELYVKFMLTLAIGLAGVSLVLLTLFESVLRDWDPLLDIGRWWRELARPRPAPLRAEDILSELEGRRNKRFVYATRPPARAVESRQLASSPDFVEAL